MAINGCEGVKRAVEAGLGVSFVSRYSIVLELAHGVIRLPGVEDYYLNRPIAIVTRKNLRSSAAALAFSAYLRKHRRDLPAPGGS